jgi:hypothetical protein
VEAIQVQAKGEQVMSTKHDYDLAVAEKLSWHKQVVFRVLNTESFAYMNDETLYNFIKYQTHVLNKGADARKARLSELEEWEKENGQDALYWAMKVICDKDTLYVGFLVGSRTRGIAIFRKRIEYNAKLRFMKSELSDDIPWDDEDDDFF